MTIIPPALQPGDTIALISLGSPVEFDFYTSEDPIDIKKLKTYEGEERLSASIGAKYLQELGYNVEIHRMTPYKFLAGSDKDRANMLERLCKREDVKMIMSNRGGTGSAGLLDYLDFDVIARHPKIITGFSDITYVANAIYQRTGLITFLGMMTIGFGKIQRPEYNVEQFFEIVNQPRPEFVIRHPLSGPPPRKSLVQGSVTGRLAGGSLVTMISSLGTPYEIDTRGKILLIEETHQDTQKVYRDLLQLKMAGKFDDCVGIVIGDCTGCYPTNNKDFDTVIKGFFHRFNKPVMTHATFSHGTYNTTFPIGALANLNTINETNTITILEPIVRAN